LGLGKESFLDKGKDKVLSALLNPKQIEGGRKTPQGGSERGRNLFNGGKNPLFRGSEIVEKKRSSTEVGDVRKGGMKHKTSLWERRGDPRKRWGS